MAAATSVVRHTAAVVLLTTALLCWSSAKADAGFQENGQCCVMATQQYEISRIEGPDEAANVKQCALQCTTSGCTAFEVKRHMWNGNVLWTSCYQHTSKFVRAQSGKHHCKHKRCFVSTDAVVAALPPRAATPALVKCTNKNPKFCQKRLTTDAKTAKLCVRKNFKHKCQQSCGIC